MLFGPDRRLVADCLAAALEAHGLLVHRPNPIDAVTRPGGRDADVADALRFAGAAVVIDDRTATGLGVERLTALVRACGDRLTLVDCSGHGRNGHCNQLAAIGAAGSGNRVIGLGDDLAGLVTALTAVIDGHCSWPRPRRSAPSCNEAVGLAALSPREQEVLTHMMSGRTARAIAEEDYVSIATVRSHIRAVLTKLGVTSQLAAVAVAHRHGWWPEVGDEALPAVGSR